MRERRRRARDEGLEGYGGLLGRTRRAPVLVTEDDGRAEVRWVYRGVNVATDPALAELARRGELLRIDRASGLQLSFVYHDPEARKFALVLPEGLRHRALEERSELIRSLGDEPEHAIPAYVAEAHVVIGVEALERFLNEAPEAPSAPAPARRQGREETGRIPQPPRVPTLGGAPPAEVDPFEALDEITPESIERELRRLVEAGDAGVAALLSALGSESSVVRLAATLGLTRSPNHEVARRLVDALLEEPTGVSRHMARALPSFGAAGFAAARSAAEAVDSANEALILAFGHLAEAGYDLEIEELAKASTGAAAEIAQRGLDAIIDARDAIALMDSPPDSRLDPIDRLASRLEAALQN